MTSLVRDAYDANAELYTSLFLHDLGHDTQSTRWLAKFAALAAQRSGPVADLGCGPGSAVDHLCGLGVDAFGIDLSAGQVAQARAAFPGLRFEVGDLAHLEFADASLGGIVSRHSLIHTPPSGLAAVFEEWLRALQPHAPVFVSFFGSKSAEAHGTPFDHTVVTAYELFPATVAQLLGDTGFVDVAVEATPIPAGGRPLDHVTLLARRAGA